MDQIARASGTGRPLEVLVAESNPVFRCVLAERLRRLGHSVRVAQTLSEALVALTERGADVVIAGVRMGDPRGVAWLETLGRRLLPPHLILLSSAPERSEASALAVRLQAHACIERNTSLPERVEAAVEMAAEAHRKGAARGGPYVRLSPAPLREVPVHA